MRINKLPKQWKHWVKSAGFRAYPRDKDLLYFKGKGRHWRVNCHTMLQVSEPYETFDRWSNSLVAEVSLPQTKAEFNDAVNWLLHQPQEN